MWELPSICNFTKLTWISLGNFNVFYNGWPLSTSNVLIGSDLQLLTTSTKHRAPLMHILASCVTLSQESHPINQLAESSTILPSLPSQDNLSQSHQQRPAGRRSCFSSHRLVLTNFNSRSLRSVGMVRLFLRHRLSAAARVQVEVRVELETGVLQ